MLFRVPKLKKVTPSTLTQGYGTNVCQMLARVDLLFVCIFTIVK